MGTQVVVILLSLPFGKPDTLVELLRRYFGNIISNKPLQAADNFIRKAQATKQEAQHVKDQIKILLSAMGKAKSELEQYKIRLEECEKREKK